MSKISGSIAKPPLRSPWLVLFSVSIAQLMSVMGITFLLTGLPQIAVDLGSSLADLQWIVIVYTLVMAATVPLWGRLSDLVERKDLFLIGVGLFVAGGFLGSQAGSTGVLILARAIQGLGAASMMVNTLAIITDVFPLDKRALAFGLQAVIVSSGGAIGPAIGGVVITQVGWEATFLITCALGTLIFVLGMLVLPRGNMAKRREPLDWTGAVVLAASLGAALLAVTRGQQWGWDSPRVLGLFAAGGLLGLVFLLLERRHSYPLVDLSMFRFRVFALGQFVALFGLTAISTHDFLMPFFWQGARGFAAQEAGLMLIPFSAGIFSGAPLAGRMIHRFGARSLMAVGLVFVIVGLALISQLTVHSSIPDVVWRSWLCGFGFGMYFTPNNHIIMSAIPSWQRGVASGVLGMFRMIGAAVGTAVSGTIVAIIVTNRFEGLSGSLVTKQDFALAASDPQRLERLNNAFSDGFQAAFLVALAFVTIALLLTIMLPSRIEEPEEAEETQILQMERADASSLPQPAQSES